VDTLVVVVAQHHPHMVEQTELVVKVVVVLVAPLLVMEHMRLVAVAAAEQVPHLHLELVVTAVLVLL
jgi:hypothetical protein|tara:strand:+ start:496 stop:696 length:201 start_codon:yes stop_codon:yes gene_type:complete